MLTKKKLHNEIKFLILLNCLTRIKQYFSPVVRFWLVRGHLDTLGVAYVVRDTQASDKHTNILTS